jgi:hypothetical protein
MILDWIVYLIVILAAFYVCRYIYNTWISMKSGCGCSKKACPLTKIPHPDKTQIDSQSAKK